ncbi:MAG: methionine adenosyltransferase [Nitrospira sp.]|nr:methionine adenosyltransferase [Nitrospira sp.]MCP9442727.1 methionine adenosyltransferase [Nitrospira sp.]
MKLIEPMIIESSRLAPAEEAFEIVERKGLGHPDTICDAVMEAVAVQLAQAYLTICGRVLHFNADKGMLVAGQVECRFGGGSVLTPMRLVMGDRATFQWRNKQIPVKAIAERTAYRWFQRRLPRIQPHKDVECQVELKPASEELQSVTERPHEAVANDTSATVGYAPLTPTERLVLQIERFLNGRAFKKEFPDTGEDVKVLAIRREQELTVTVAMPFLAPQIRNEAQYFKRKAAAERILTDFVTRECAAGLSPRIFLNVLDRCGAGEAGTYLTLLGTSAEAGDSGEVGRGNRVCGIISLRRPASAEAAPGKNPAAHVGKIYNVLAQTLAETLYNKIRGLRDVTVWITSQIGRPISSPQSVVVDVMPARGTTLATVRPQIEREIRTAFTHLPLFCKKLARGLYSMY